MKISKENKPQVLAYNSEDEILIIADPVEGAMEYALYNKSEVLDEMISEVTCDSIQDFAGTNSLFLHTAFARLGKNTFMLTDGLDHLIELGLREDAVKLTDEFFKD